MYKPLIVGFFLSLWATTASAEDHPMSHNMEMLLVEEQPMMSLDPEGFGTHGYRHLELHDYGTIDALIKSAGKSCCSSPYDGECRATRIKFKGSERFFQYGKITCPLSVSTIIRFDVEMPEDVEAVVCAANTAPNVCPNTYCAAVKPGA